MTKSQAYESVKELIDKTVRGFVRKYGGDYEDLRADANTAWLNGHTAWVEGRANADKYSVEIRRWVWFELFDNYRNKNHLRSKNRVATIGGAIVESVAEPDTFDMNVFFDELPEEASLVVSLVFDTPEELARVIFGKGGEPRNFRSSIRDYLKGLGWTAMKINECFNEIRQALTC